MFLYRTGPHLPERFVIGAILIRIGNKAHKGGVSVVHSTKAALVMFTVLLVFLVVFGAGFAAGYGVREMISRRRRRRSFTILR